MKISIYLPSLHGGGAERSMVTLANGFAMRGYKVDLVLVKAEGPYISEVSDKVDIINLSSSSVLKSLPRFVRYIRRANPEIILSAMSHANVIAILANFLSGLRSQAIVSERESLAAAISARRGIKYRILRFLMRTAYPYADKIVTVSSAMQNEIIHHFNIGQNKVTYIYNPIVNEKLYQLAKCSIEHPWYRDEKGPLILAVGRLTAQKDYPTLIKAFSQLRYQVHEARLVILGEGEDRESLNELVQASHLQSYVSLPGFISNPFPYMKRASLFVLSSRWEGLPGVLIQAMACGTPVVSTDCPTGPSEILENGKWGRLVPVGDVQALAQAMLEALEDVKHPDVKLRAAEFSDDIAITKYLELIGGVVGA